jgi:hypothetical protein
LGCLGARYIRRLMFSSGLTLIFRGDIWGRGRQWEWRMEYEFVQVQGTEPTT